MGKRERLAQQVKDTEARWQQLGVLLGKMKLARDLETRVDEQLRLDARLAEIVANQNTVSNDLDGLEAQLAALLDQPSAASASPPLEVFWSYAHADELLRDELARQLDSSSPKLDVVHFHDRRIEPRDEPRAAIARHLNAASLILLLISADYLASDELDVRELNPAMARHRSGDALVLPIILSPCDWRDSAFSALVVLPQDGVPVVSWPDRKLALRAVAERISKTLQDLIAARARHGSASSR